MKRRPTIAIDFDGVLHAYSKGWLDGSCYDDPNDGTAAALRELRLRYRLVVLTARHDLDAVRTWLLKHGLLHFFEDITNRKPAAAVYLDDRALKFTSWAAALDEIGDGRH